MLDSLHVCGHILTTKDYNYFALRCVQCEAPFGQWTSFIKHLEHQHGHDVLKGECNSEEEFLEEEHIEEEVNSEQPLLEELKSDSEAEREAATEWDAGSQSADDVEEQEQQFIVSKTNDEKCKKQNSTEDDSKHRKLRRKKSNMFSFNLQDPESQEISFEFLKVLESKRLLWDSQHKSYRETEARAQAMEAIKAHFAKQEYNIPDRTLYRLIPKIISNYKQAQQTLAVKGKVNKQAQLILEKCKFLSEVVGNEKTAVLSDMDDELDNDFNDDKNESTDDSENSTADTGTEYYKEGGIYKRFRFHVYPNPIVTELIQLLRANPLLWDTTRSDYNNITDRRYILSNWITIFEERHNVTFTYEELSKNLQVLRRLYNNMSERKSMDEAALYLKEQCSFLPEPKPMVRIKCEHCERTFLMQINYQAHLYTTHNIGENPFKCEHCVKEFPSYSQLDAHQKAVHIKTYSFFCDVCNRGFLRKNELTFHMHVHTGEKTFICETCGKAFRRRLNLKNHEIRIHLRQRNFSCELCPKAFYTKALLRDHMNAHLDIRRHMCPTCGKGFHSAHALMRHKQIHSEVKRYACKLCDARFHQFVGLNSHMKNKHKFVQAKDDDEVAAPLVTRNEGEDGSSPSETMHVEMKDELLQTPEDYVLV